MVATVKMVELTVFSRSSLTGITRMVVDSLVVIGEKRGQTEVVISVPIIRIDHLLVSRVRVSTVLEAHKG